MKKSNMFSVFGCGIFFFFLAFLMNVRPVNAVSYDYTKGKVEVKSTDNVVVNSFSFDYKTTGIDISDGADDLSDDIFYSSNKITVNIDHYDALAPWKDDKDKTYLYKYNAVSESFILIESYEEGSYEFKDQGFYKVKYEFGNKIEVNYIFINHTIHAFDIEVDEKYSQTSAFKKFNFKLNLKDGLSLSKNSYSYSFGTDENSLQYIQIQNSAILGSSQDVLSVEDKAVSLEFDARFVSANDQDQKYFFFKITDAAGNVKGIYKSPNKYILANTVGAVAHMVDSEGNKIDSTDTKYFKKGETVYVEVVFNAPVAYTNLQYSFGNGKVFPINDSVEPANSFRVSYEIVDNTGFVGDFKLSTKNNTDTIVNFEGENGILAVNTDAVNFVADVAAPVINIETAGDPNGRKDYNVSVNVVEEYLDKVYYYASTCKVAQGDSCTDSYDDANVNIAEAVFVPGENAANAISIILDSKYGKFNGENLILFVKAFDKSGNSYVASKFGYLVDNVIIPEDANKEEVFVLSNIQDGENNVIGKKLSVVVDTAYGVTAVSYKLGENSLECTSTGVSGGNKATFECLSVQNYDFRYNVELKILDAFANEEIYNIDFKYTTIVDGTTANVTFANGSADVTLYTNEKYEIEYVENNLMRVDQDEAIFNSETLNKIEQILNLNNVPNMSDLVVKVVYLNGEEEVVLATVENEYRLPNLQELEELLGDYIDFKACASNKCEGLEIYLKYEYKAEGTPQERFVKIRYEDNSNKYKLDQFETEKTIEYAATYAEPSFVFVNILNSQIDAALVTRNIVVTHINKDGVATPVERVNPNVLGKYVVRESFSYNSLSSFVLEYSVNVVDTKAPTIRLNGSETIKVNLGEKFNDPSVVVSDNHDKDFTIQTKIEPELDTKKEGTYKISYWVVDSSGNTSEIVTRTVVVEKQNSLTSYLIAGGVALVVIAIIVIVSLKEFKKGKRRG